MAINTSPRQWPLYSAVEVDAANYAAGEVSVTVPYGAIILESGVNVAEAFVGLTTPTAEGVDLTASGANGAYSGGLSPDVSEAGSVKFTLADGGGTATAGSAQLVVGYIVAGRATENQNDP